MSVSPFFVLANMILNALVFIVPGAITVGVWFVNTYSNTGIDADGVNLWLGVGTFGYGLLNLGAVLTAFQTQGRMRSSAIAMGYVLSVLSIPAGVAIYHLFLEPSFAGMSVVTGIVQLATIITIQAPKTKQDACVYCGCDLAGLPIGECPACSEPFGTDRYEFVNDVDGESEVLDGESD